MAVGIFGGTFDPVHTGHLITAQSVLEKRNLEKIIFIPAYISPHKKDKENTASKHRLRMLEIATEQNDKFVVCDYELKKKIISYTIDTIRELKKDYNNIELIIGYDNLITFHKWHKPDEIIKLCKLVVMHRLTDKNEEEKNKYFDKAVILDTPTIEISSTDIRERVKKGLPIDYLVPLQVKEYIYKNGLYK